MPRSSTIKHYTAQEWHDISNEEQDRQIINMVNMINRRMKRMEEAGLTEVPGYQAVLKESERYSVTGKDRASKQAGQARLTKALSKMTEREKRKYHSRLIELGGLKTGSVSRARKVIEEMGVTSTGKVLFTYGEYLDMSPVQKGAYWEQFHRLRDILKKQEKYISGKGPESSLAAFNEEYLNAGKRPGQRMNMTKKRLDRIMELQTQAIINAGNYDKTPPQKTGFGLRALDD